MSKVYFTLRLRIRRADKIAHDSIHLGSYTTYINNVITECRLRWLEHILRRPSPKLTHISLVAKPYDGWYQKQEGLVKA
ncbi:unnamed protein product [Dracunculus medinensis]|uniref:Transposase n=1 Tax=Dracunculus medinensis TaxID=318479 RepID=A0A0N4UPN8_DRAME|nr:unnamed protein product [Dracunculus medinensis]